MSSDEVFILRFWLEEDGTDDELRWRAQVRSVNTRQRQITDDLESAFALIVDRLRAALSGRPEEKEGPQ